MYGALILLIYIPKYVLYVAWIIPTQTLSNDYTTLKRRGITMTSYGGNIVNGSDVTVSMNAISAQLLLCKRDMPMEVLFGLTRDVIAFFSLSRIMTKTSSIMLWSATNDYGCGANKHIIYIEDVQTTW